MADRNKGRTPPPCQRCGQRRVSDLCPLLEGGEAVVLVEVEAADLTLTSGLRPDASTLERPATSADLVRRLRHEVTAALRAERGRTPTP